MLPLGLLLQIGFVQISALFLHSQKQPFLFWDKENKSFCKEKLKKAGLKVYIKTKVNNLTTKKIPTAALLYSSATQTADPFSQVVAGEEKEVEEMEVEKQTQVQSSQLPTRVPDSPLRERFTHDQPREQGARISQVVSTIIEQADSYIQPKSPPSSQVRATSPLSSQSRLSPSRASQKSSVLGLRTGAANQKSVDALFDAISKQPASYCSRKHKPSPPHQEAEQKLVMDVTIDGQPTIPFPSFSTVSPAFLGTPVSTSNLLAPSSSPVPYSPSFSSSFHNRIEDASGSQASPTKKMSQTAEEPAKEPTLEGDKSEEPEKATKRVKFLVSDNKKKGRKRKRDQGVTQREDKRRKKETKILESDDDQESQSLLYLNGMMAQETEEWNEHDEDKDRNKYGDRNGDEREDLVTQREQKKSPVEQKRRQTQQKIQKQTEQPSDDIFLHTPRESQSIVSSSFETGTAAPSSSVLPSAPTPYAKLPSPSPSPDSDAPQFSLRPARYGSLSHPWQSIPTTPTNDTQTTLTQTNKTRPDLSSEEPQIMTTQTTITHSNKRKLSQPIRSSQPLTPAKPIKKPALTKQPPTKQSSTATQRKPSLFLSQSSFSFLSPPSLPASLPAEPSFSFPLHGHQSQELTEWTTR